MVIGSMLRNAHSLTLAHVPAVCARVIPSREQSRYPGLGAQGNEVRQRRVRTAAATATKRPSLANAGNSAQPVAGPFLSPSDPPSRTLLSSERSGTWMQP